MTSFTDLEKKVRVHAQYGDELKPVRDWLVLLSIGAALLIVSVAWNAWVYLATAETASSETAMPAQAVNTNAIDAAQNIFAARAAEEANYENIYHFVDPSK